MTVLFALPEALSQARKRGARRFRSLWRRHGGRQSLTPVVRRSLLAENPLDPFRKPLSHLRLKSFYILWKSVLYCIQIHTKGVLLLWEKTVQFAGSPDTNSIRYVMNICKCQKAAKLQNAKIAEHGIMRISPAQTAGGGRFNK